MYKYVVFFDLDHTLFNEDAEITPEIVALIDKVRANGGLPVIATGRSLFELTRAINLTKINTIIASNGAYGVYNNKTIFKHKLSIEFLNEIVRFANQLGDDVVLLNEQEGRMTNNTFLSKKANQNGWIPQFQLASSSFWYHNPVYMILIITALNDKKYIEKFSSVASFYYSSDLSIDAVNKGVSKRSGIIELIKKAHLEGLPTYAFGDGNNDIEMLDFVDHPIVMKNGLVNVKKHAEYITTSNTNHGVMKGLKHFNLI